VTCATASLLLNLRVSYLEEALRRKGETHALVDATSKSLSGLLVEGKSYPKELSGPGCAAQAGKSRALIRSAAYGSAELAPERS